MIFTGETVEIPLLEEPPLPVPDPLPEELPLPEPDPDPDPLPLPAPLPDPEPEALPFPEPLSVPSVSLQAIKSEVNIVNAKSKAIILVIFLI
jgi:hypothetical protein